MSNAINPEHYNRLNPQPKDVIRAWGLNFNLGSAVKYISRAGHKDDIVQDLKKAQEFIQFEIDAIEGARAERKDKPKHEDFMDALLHGLFGVGDVVDINYRKPFDPRGVGYNGDAGLTGRIADIKDAVIYVDAGTLFHSNIVAITLDTVLYVAKAEHEHIEDMRRA